MRIVVLALMLVLGGCTEKAGDPGDERLHALERSQVLDLRPRGARETERHSRDAFQPPYTSDWVGPSVWVDYELIQGVAEAEDFYVDRIKQLGWELERGPTGSHETWLFTRDMGGWKARLTLDVDREEGAGVTVRVIAWAPPVVMRSE